MIVITAIFITFTITLVQPLELWMEWWEWLISRGTELMSRGPGMLGGTDRDHTLEERRDAGQARSRRQCSEQWSWVREETCSPLSGGEGGAGTPGYWSSCSPQWGAACPGWRRRESIHERRCRLSSFISDNILHDLMVDKLGWYIFDTWPFNSIV